MTKKNAVTLIRSEEIEFLSRVQVAAKLHVSVQTLANWASEEKGPRCKRLGREVVYLRHEVEAYMLSVFFDEVEVAA